MCSDECGSSLLDLSPLALYTVFYRLDANGRDTLLRVNKNVRAAFLDVALDLHPRLNYTPDIKDGSRGIGSSLISVLQRRKNPIDMLTVRLYVRKGDRVGYVRGKQIRNFLRNMATANYTCSIQEAFITQAGVNKRGAGLWQRALGPAFPGVQVLQLSGCRISMDMIASICQHCRRLERLVLSRCEEHVQYGSRSGQHAQQPAPAAAAGGAGNAAVGGPGQGAMPQPGGGAGGHVQHISLAATLIAAFADLPPTPQAQPPPHPLTPPATLQSLEISAHPDATDFGLSLKIMRALGPHVSRLKLGALTSPAAPNRLNELFECLAAIASFPHLQHLDLSETCNDFASSVLLVMHMPRVTALRSLTVSAGGAFMMTVRTSESAILPRACHTLCLKGGDIELYALSNLQQRLPPSVQTLVLEDVSIKVPLAPSMADVQAAFQQVARVRLLELRTAWLVMQLCDPLAQQAATESQAAQGAAGQVGTGASDPAACTAADPAASTASTSQPSPAAGTTQQACPSAAASTALRAALEALTPLTPHAQRLQRGISLGLQLPGEADVWVDGALVQSLASSLGPWVTHLALYFPPQRPPATGLQPSFFKAASDELPQLQRLSMHHAPRMGPDVHAALAAMCTAAPWGSHVEIWTHASVSHNGDQSLTQQLAGLQLHPSHVQLTVA